MRREWMEPVIEVQEFVANEYVAACGDSGKVYNFECNAGKENSHYNVYTNGVDGIAHTRDDGECLKKCVSKLSDNFPFACLTTLL